MHLIADLCVVPMGLGLSLSPYVAECERVLREHGLEPFLHPNGSGVEGDWDVVMHALKACHERLHEMGAVRVHTTCRFGTRTDREQKMADKLASVEEKLSHTGGTVSD